MNIVETILGKIFSTKGAAAPAPSTTPSPQAAPGAQARVDVAAVLSGLAQRHGQKLDWQHSIVDLLKLLNMDSSLAARQKLAKELNYTGDLNKSAEMNVWLQKRIMEKMAENGGKVPNELLH